MSKLSKRLQTVANLVSGNIVADIGCDHGKLAEYLLENSVVKKMIVSDISAPSLQKAIDLLCISNYNFEAICCDGLQGYQGKDIDQCIISGMGGDEIMHIISNSPIQINSFILSPQHNNIDVKKFMLNAGYNIDYDIIIKDKGKFYNIFRCNKSNNIVEKLNEFDLLFGKNNFNTDDSDVDEFVEYEIGKLEKLFSSQDIKNEQLQQYFQLLKEYSKRK